MLQLRVRRDQWDISLQFFPGLRLAVVWGTSIEHRRLFCALVTSPVGTQAKGIKELAWSPEKQWDGDVLEWTKENKDRKEQTGRENTSGPGLRVEAL